MPQQLSTNTFGTAKWVVSQTASDGTHTTIQDAINSASPGDTIFIRPGSYGQNVILSPGVNLAAYSCDALNSQVTIAGNCSLSTAGSVSISGVSFQTASNYCISVVGSSDSELVLENCFINCSNFNGIQFNSSGNSVIVLFDSFCDLGTSDISLYDHSSDGNLIFYNCVLNNSGLNGTSSANSSGSVLFTNCTLAIPLATTGTGNVTIYNSSNDTSGTNTRCLLTSGTGSAAIYCSYIATGTASAISVGAGTTVQIASSAILSTNFEAITGAGHIVYGGVTFLASTGINTTTQTPITLTVQQGGTARSSFTPFSVVCGGASPTTPLQVVGTLGSAGQVLTSGGAGVLPTWAASTGMIPWVNVTGTTQALVSNTSYVVTNTGLPTLTLPLTSVLGDVIEIQGATLSGWILAQNAGQSIVFGFYTTTLGGGGGIRSFSTSENLSMVCIEDNLTWAVRSSLGSTLTIS